MYTIFAVVFFHSFACVFSFPSSPRISACSNAHGSHIRHTFARRSYTPHWCTEEHWRVTCVCTGNCVQFSNMAEIRALRWIVCFLFSLIGCCRRRCCWLISLTSAVNWNIILIVFLCWPENMLCRMLGPMFGTAKARGVWTDENQYISIKKRRKKIDVFQSEARGEIVKWKKKKKKQTAPHYAKDPHKTFVCVCDSTHVIDSGVAHTQDTTRCCRLFVLPIKCFRLDRLKREEKHCFRWWIVFFSRHCFVCRKRFYFTFRWHSKWKLNTASHVRYRGAPKGRLFLHFVHVDWEVYCWN